MYCRNCGSLVETINSICPTCGYLPLNGKSFCQECGYETQKDQEICINCNSQLKYATIANKSTASYNQTKQTNQNQNDNFQSYYSNQPYDQKYKQSSYNNTPIDEPNTLANLGACCSVPFTCIPIVGIVLYFVWKDEKPNAAKSVLMWSLIPFIFVAIFYIIVFISSSLNSLIFNIIFNYY